MIVLLFGVLLTACTPPSISISAVFLDDGRPTAVFHPCSGTDVDVVSVAEELPGTATSTGAATSSVPTSGTVSTDQHFWSVADDPRSRHPVTQVRLLEIPAGWSLQTTAPGALISTFVEDRSYYLSAETTDRSAGNDAGLRFTLSDLRSLAAGQVWAAPEAYAQAEAMSREDFETAAARSC